MAETVTCAACGAEVVLEDPILLATCACGAEVRSRRHPRDTGNDTEIDLYKLLGIDRGATEAEIREAYRRRARETHPDVGGDAAEFQAVQAAYETLSDPSRRRAYDRTGRTGDRRRGPSGNVPDVVGMSPVEASRTLLTAGYVPRLMLRPVSGSSPLANRVIGQQPGPEAGLTPGAPVAIVVAVAEAGALWARVRELTRDFAQGVLDGFAAATSRSGRSRRIELDAGDTSRDRGRAVGAVAGSVTVGAVRTAGCLVRTVIWLAVTAAITVASFVIGLFRPALGIAVFVIAIVVVTLLVTRGYRLQRERWRSGDWV